MLVPKVNANFSLKDAISGIISLFRNKDYNNRANNPYYLNHARAGLRVAITALDLPEGSKIGITMYNCYTVMNAIKKAGHVIVFIDTTDDLRMDINDLKEKKTQIDALIITHLFGLPNDMDEIKKNCPLIPIIEDCAHSFLSSSAPYQTGAVGDFAVFSIGLGKFPSIGDGGILKVNNDDYINKVKTEIEQLKFYSYVDEIKLIFKLLFTSIIHNPIIYKWVSLPRKKKQHKKKNINPNYKHSESHMAKSVKYLFEEKYDSFESAKFIQQKNAKKVWMAIKENNSVYLPSIDFEYNNCFMLPFLHPNREVYSLYLSEYGVEIAPHFAKSIIWAEEFGYEAGNCKNAEKIAEQILVIPVHHRVKSDNLNRMIKGLKSYNSVHTLQ